MGPSTHDPRGSGADGSLPRRGFLIGSAIGLVTAAAATLTSCGDDATSATPTTTGNGYQLIASFPRSDPYAAAGAPQRLPLLIAGPDGAPLDQIRGDVVFEVHRDTKRVGAPITVSPHSEGLERAYLPLEVTFPDVGTYDISARYRGSTMTTTLSAVDPATVTVPQVGAALPAVATPTTDDHRGVDPICTRDPQCPFHSVNLTDALASGRPTLLLVSTPQFCQIAICGPVLDLLIEAAKKHDDVTVIHQEVYANPRAVASISEATPAPLLSAYGMTFEPSLFVVDRNGILARRLDTIYDRAELADAIRSVTT